MTTATSAESAILGIASLNPITAAIAALYSVASGINDFINSHIEVLKKSENPTIASTGRVLEAAKFGFGLGYLSSVAIMAVGQLILGNNLVFGAGSVASTLSSAAVLSNPIAMTCGAVGAIYYGWNALTREEQDAILHRISIGLEIGVELIKSLISFVVRKSKELLDSKHLTEFKVFVGAQAQRFGKNLSDVTRLAGDKFNDLLDWSKSAAQEVGGGVARVSEEVAAKAIETGEDVGRGVSAKIKEISGSVADVVQSVKDRVGK